MAADAAAVIGRGQRVGIVAADEDVFPGVSTDAVTLIRIGPERDARALAANLYHALRALDASGVDVILARAFTDQSGLIVAIHDRLRRAAAGRIVRVTP